MKGWSHSDGFLRIKEEEDEPLPLGYYRGSVYLSLGWQDLGYVNFLLGGGPGYSGRSDYQYGYYNQVLPYNALSTYFNLIPPDYIL